MNTPIKGTITLETLDPSDIPSAISTMPKNSRVFGASFPPLGTNAPEKLLGWAEAEIAIAGDLAKNQDERARNADAAVMHARRALDSLVEWYLKGFGLLSCKNAPQNGWDKSTRLLERNIIDHLTRKVLARAIDDRNKIEHQYDGVDLSRAEDIVEMIRWVCRHLTNVRPPDQAPCLIGAGFGYGVSGGSNSTQVTFTGWRGLKSAQLLLATFTAEPWLGIIVPSSNSEALLRRAKLQDIPADTIEAIWRHFDFLQVNSSVGFQIWELFFNEIGIQ